MVEDNPLMSDVREILAKRFYEEGYQAFVLTYTTNMFQIAPLNKQPLKDISRAVRYIRGHAEELHVQGGRIACCGFSGSKPLLNTSPRKNSMQMCQLCNGSRWH